MKKSILVVLMCAVMIVGLFVSQAAAAQEVKIIVEGESIALDAKPVIYKGRVLVPVRQIVESIGGDVTWNSGSQTVSVVKDQKNILLVINNNTAKVNNVNQTLDVPARIIGGRTMIPLRFVSQNLGTTVNWDPKTYTVTIEVPVNLNNEAYDLLVKASEKNAANRQSKYDFKANASLSGNSAGVLMNYNVEGSGTMKMDLDKPAFGFDGKVSVKDKGVSMGFDFAFRMIENNMYMMDPTTGKWSKESIPAEDFAKVTELLKQKQLSAEFTSKMLEQMKSSVRTVDFAGEKTVNGVKTKGVSMELSGLKYKKMLKDIILEAQKTQGMQVTESDLKAFDEVFSGVELNRYEVTYWIDQDNNIHDINLDLKVRVAFQQEVDMVFAITADIALSEVNKPQQITAPEVTDTL